MFIELLEKLFFTDKKKESDKLKYKMCLEARMSGMCKEPHCDYCAWQVNA